jgi:hypothetical protein
MDADKDFRVAIKCFLTQQAALFPDNSRLTGNNAAFLQISKSSVLDKEFIHP